MDYLIVHEDKVVPVEIKAGATGTLKSLQVFVVEKNSPVAIRFNAMPPLGASLPQEFSFFIMVRELEGDISECFLGFFDGLPAVNRVFFHLIEFFFDKFNGLKYFSIIGLEILLKFGRIWIMGKKSIGNLQTQFRLYWKE